MPTIVDALVVSLALDATAFTKAQREAADSFKKTGDEAVKTGKKVEAAAVGMTENLSKATRAFLELGALFLGGRGFKDLIEGANRANTAIGTLSTGLGSSPEIISAWSMAAERMGGSAAATQASIQALSDSLVDFRTQGKQLPMELFLLEAQSGKSVDFQHGWEKFMITAADAANTMAKTDPAGANRFLRAIGFDPSTTALMISQGPRMKSFVEQMKRLAPTDKDVAAAKGMTRATTELNQQYGFLATRIGTAIAPMMELLAKALGWLAETLGKVVEANPVATEAIVGILGVLTAGKIFLAIKNLLALKDALLGLGAANAASSGGGLLGLLARLNPYVAGAAAAGYVMSPTEANGGEDERARHERYSGNAALRRRGRTSDIALGKSGKLSDNQREAFAAARQEGLSETAARALVADLSGEGLAHDAHRVHWDVSHYAHGSAQWDDVRSATIKSHFGKAPEEMSVADQTRAAIWEMKTNPRFSKTWRAMQGNNAGDMIDALVRNYEGPADKGRAIAERSRIYGGLGGLSVGARTSAALNNISNTHNATTSSSSNEAHIGTINVNAPNATDANGIASGIDSALAARMFASHANYGPN